jgi:hypothetical protein
MDTWNLYINSVLCIVTQLGDLISHHPALHCSRVNTNGQIIATSLDPNSSLYMVYLNYNPLPPDQKTH